MSIVDQEYPCIFCHKSFRYQTLLRRHVRCHTGEKPYVCIFCNQTFTQKSNLEKHVRIHTGERPFQCPFCHRSFTQKSNVHRHMRTHTGERPYVCPLCNRSFSQKSNVERHLKTHTEENADILDNNVLYSAKAVLDQNTKDVFDKITNSLKPEADVSVKSSTETFLRNRMSRDNGNIISPMTILDGTHKIYSCWDQNAKNRILSQSYLLYKTETDIPVQIMSSISKDDFRWKESNTEIFDPGSNFAEDESSIDKKGSVNSNSDNNDDTIINKHCVEIKPPPHERLFWKKSNENKILNQFQRSDSLEPNPQENQPATPKVDPCVDPECLTEKKSVKKSIPQTRKPYQEIAERFDKNFEKMDQPALDYLEDHWLKNTKSSCGGGAEKNITFKTQHGLLEDKIELQEDEKEEPIRIVNKDTILNSKTTFEMTSMNQGASTMAVDDYHCPICMKTFAHKCNIGKHMLLHAGVKPYRCIICGKTFSQKSNTQRHMKTHANEQQQSKNFEESSGNNSILEKDKIKDSTKILSNKELQKIKEQSCNKLSSVTDSVLKDSSTVFSKCDVYSKEFPNNEHLSSSISKSSSQPVNTIHKKTFKCNLCSTVFLNLAELSRHIRVHKENHSNNKLNESTKDLNFQSTYNGIYTDIKRSSPDLISCEFCGHKFLDLWELSKHEEICHIENKAYTCEPCRSIVLGTREYLTHLKKFHKKNDSNV